MQLELSFTKEECPWVGYCCAVDKMWASMRNPVDIHESILADALPVVYVFPVSSKQKEIGNKINAGTPVALDGLGRVYRAGPHQTKDIIGVALGSPTNDVVQVMMYA